MKKTIKMTSVLSARCPACDRGRVLQGLFSVRPRCPECDYNFYPEPGFYLGAMCVGYLLTAVLTVPLLITLKVLDVDIKVLLMAPFLEFAVVGTLIIFYSRILWLHLEHAMTDRLERRDKRE